MQRVAFLPLLLSGTLVAASRLHRGQGRLAVDVKEHPVQKTIALLKELGEKSLKNAQEEEHLYGKFDKWCKDSDKALSKAIAAGKQKIDSLKDKVSSLEKEEKSLDKSIEKLGDEIAEHEGASTAAKTARDEENGLYDEADKDLESTIDAISQALDAMKDSETATTALLQAKVGRLLQVPMLLAQLTSRQQELLVSAAGTASDADTTTTKPDLMSKGDLAKHQKVYEFKGGNIIELLKSLLAKFEDDRVEATKAETNAQNAYELTEDARQKAIETADSAKKEKETILGDVQSDLEETKLTLEGCLDDLEADEKSLGSTQDSCKLKASEYATRVELQKGEQEAIAKAVEILAKVTGVSTEQPTNPVPPPSPLQLLQMPPQASPQRQKALSVLRSAARASHSQEFADLVEQVAAAADGPFDKVNDMMQKMIFRLMAEQKDEDEHKVWCDKELEKVNISTADKEEKIETLEAKIKDGDAKVGQLSQDIKDADDMVATLEGHMEEATEVRTAAKAENKAAIKDAQDAQTAIAQATAVLEAYYKESGAIQKEAWEFVQRQREPVEVPENPSTWDASYTGIADPNNAPDGIISMLKEISADFSKMESNTLATEEMDQKAYEEEIKDCKIEKAERMKESEMKTEEKKRLLDKIASLEKSLKHTSNELEMVQQYLKDLGPACIEGDSTYDERKTARSDEITALKEAQVILEEAFDEAPSFLEVQEMPLLHYPNGLRTRIAKQMSELDGRRLRAATAEKAERAERAAAAARAVSAAAKAEKEHDTASNHTAANATQPLPAKTTVLLSPHAGYWGTGIKERIARELSGAEGDVHQEVSTPSMPTPSMRGPVRPPAAPAVAVVDAASNTTTNSTSSSATHSIASLISSFFTRFIPSRA